jgi:hypothetical protein
VTVYYIGHPSGLVKIGYAANALTRLEGLERQYRTALIIVAHEPGMAAVERIRHDQFHADRLNRHQEWFRPSPELRDHMQRLLPTGVELGQWPEPDPAIRRVDREE